MSDNIPFEIQVEIMKRLPVKSILQFRSVSKQWKSVIDSSEFITAHGLNQTQSHLLLLAFGIDRKNKFVSIVEDDTHTLSLRKVKKPFRRPFYDVGIVGCSSGLVCLTTLDIQSQNHVVFIWNPSIRKCVRMVIMSESYSKRLGFGVCPKTGDPKLVRLTRPVSETDDWKAEVFTLSSGAWRRVPLNLCWANTEMHFLPYQVVIDTVIHWIAYDGITKFDVIVSFDFTTEEFEEVNVSFAKPKRLSISKLKGSLVLLGYNKEALVYDVWMMIKSGRSKSSFTKLFTVSFKPTPETVYYDILGSRKNGMLMVQHMRLLDGVIQTTLEIHDANSKQFNEIERDIWCKSMLSYTESLLLLNHSDSIIQSYR